MGRRRRSQAQIENIFYKAFEVISEREDQVIYSSIKPTFTCEDVARWFFTDDTIRKLKEAFPLAKGIYNSRFIVNNVPSQYCSPLTFTFDCEKIHMCTPKDNVLNFQPHRSAGIPDTLKEFADIHARFNKVRDVIRWFGEHKVTPGAARYYWPTILALLPSGHAVHEADGERYRPVTGISEIIPLLRETSGIVAAAIMAPPRGPLGAAAFTVAFAGKDQRTFTVL